MMWHFTSEERRGLTIWGVCIISIVLAPYYLPLNNQPESMEELLKEWQVVNSSAELDSNHNSLAGETARDSAKAYNPNTITAAQLEDRGLPSFIAERWIRFRSAKGKFTDEKDIRSIYGIDSLWVEKERPFWNWNSSSDSDQNRLKKQRAQTLLPSQKKEKGPSRSKHKSPIDINQAPASAFEKLGFQKGVAHRLIAYRKKAGPFYQPQDLYAIYDVDSQLVKTLIPLLMIDTARLTYLDINTAQEEELENLPGIGPVYAERIVKFRDALGGFIDKEQVKETYGLPESTWIRIEPRIKLQDRNLKKLRIHEANIEEFARHPYIDWSLAKRLYRYVQQHKPIENLESMHGLPQATKVKIYPYLDFSASTETVSEVAQLNREDPK